MLPRHTNRSPTTTLATPYHHHVSSTLFFADPPTTRLYTLSPRRSSDLICVLEHGRVIELGTHDELMALRGRYRTMFDLQAERFNVPADEEGTTYDVLS